MMTKSEVLESLEQLLDDATIEDMMEQLCVLSKSRKVSRRRRRGSDFQDEARERLDRWLRSSGPLPRSTRSWLCFLVARDSLAAAGVWLSGSSRLRRDWNHFRYRVGLSLTRTVAI